MDYASSNESTCTSVCTWEEEAFGDDEPLDEEPEAKLDLKTVDMETIPEFAAIKKSESREEFFVLIHLKAPSVSTALDSPRAAVDIVAVLDVSGSMAGSKLHLLKEAMVFVVRNLASHDRLSLVTFSTHARRLLRLTRMTEIGKTTALEAIKAIDVDCRTNIDAGLRMGSKQLENRRQKNPVHSIIFLSDGQDNSVLGRAIDKNPDGNYMHILPASLVGGKASKRIPVHAFGFGTDHDAPMMRSISEASGGTFSFVESPEMIRDSFAQCLGGLLSVVSQQLRVEINSMQPADIRINNITSGIYPSRVLDEGKAGEIDVGELYAYEERDLLVSINLPEICLGEEEKEEEEEEKEEALPVLKIGCAYKEPVSNREVDLGEAEVRVRRPVEVKPEEMVVSSEVEKQKRRFEAVRVVGSAVEAADGGDLAGARCRLEGLKGDDLGELCGAEIGHMKDMLRDTRSYESYGRAFMLSTTHANLQQRATARRGVDQEDLMMGSIRFGGTSSFTPVEGDSLSRYEMFSRELEPPLFPEVEEHEELKSVEHRPRDRGQTLLGHVRRFFRPARRPLRAIGSLPRAAGSLPDATGSLPRATGSLPRATGSLPHATGSLARAYQTPVMKEMVRRSRAENGNDNNDNNNNNRPDEEEA